jgi:hypothetical protein
VMRIDAFTGGLGSPTPAGGAAQLGALSSDGSRAFVVAMDNDVYSVNTADGARSQLTTGGKPKSALFASPDGSTVAYGTPEGGIFVIRPQGDSPGMPINVSDLAGFVSQNWKMADGKLILGYGTRGDKTGLFMLNIDTDLSTAAGLTPAFFAECTGVFAMSGDKRNFDVLLNSESAPKLEAAKAP